MSDVTPIVRRKLSQDVLDRLLQRINSGEIPRGGLLPSERQLMEMFKVGRPAIREALQDLQRMGLVVITHGEGARLIEPTAQSVLSQIATTVDHIVSGSQQHLAHLKDARTFFEVGMVRLAAARSTEADIAELTALIDSMNSARNEFASFMKFDMSFHRKIAEMTGNPIFVAVSEALLQWLSKYHIGELRKVGREVRTLDEHRHIVDRLAAHDVEGAAAAMLVHQTRAADRYRSRDES
jgi:GntR family transcriptional regulator, sialic acid-inducible nan operon repressor